MGRIDEVRALIGEAERVPRPVVLDGGAPGDAKHDAMVETTTGECEQHVQQMLGPIGALALSAKVLSQYDATHGMRVHEAAQALRKALHKVEHAVSEMRRHLDEDTP